eukprot:m.48668 g.48668  ORF g.48668 m.48668 type:complete len:163 (+) comp33910_c0_seq1:575-1063(+)
MAHSRNILVLLACFLAVQTCVPPDCDHEDCGTCGNACCTLNVSIAMPPAKVCEAMVASLKAGGPDKLYTFVGMYDMSKDNMTAKYILQSIHSTKVHHYNDTQDYVIFEHKKGMSTVKAFSISQIWGAYCDEGQNYKNLVGYVKGLGVKYDVTPVAGCPPKSG